MGKRKTNAEAVAEAQSEITALLGSPRPVNVRELLDNLRSCSLASSITAVKNRKKDGEHEKKCYRYIFEQVVGRKPTGAEVLHMVGGIELRSETA